MHNARDAGTERSVALAQAVRIFVLPPLLSLVVVASSLMVLLSYQTERNLQTTYVVKKMQLGGVCVVCHDGSRVRLPFRLAALH